MAPSLRDQIRQFLLEDWDPTDAARSEHARGAYDAYISPLLDLIRSGADESAVIDFLYDREQEILCFPGLGKGAAATGGEKANRRRIVTRSAPLRASRHFPYSPPS